MHVSKMVGWLKVVPPRSAALALTVLAHFNVAMAAVVASSGATVVEVAKIYDPWTWVIGGFGAAVVYIKKDVTSRMDAIVNSAISVVLAGVVAPELTSYVADKLDIPITSPYPLAFVLSATWPWIIPALASLIKVNVK